MLSRHSCKHTALNTDLLKLVLITIHDSNSQHQFLSIVIIEDAVQVITKT